MKSSSLSNSQEFKRFGKKIATFTNVSGRRVFFRDFTFILQLPDFERRSTAQGLHLRGDELVFHGWYRNLTFEPLCFATDRRDLSFRSPTATIRASACRSLQSGFPLAGRRAKGQLWEPTQTRSMVPTMLLSSLQEFDLVQPGCFGLF